MVTYAFSFLLTTKERQDYDRVFSSMGIPACLWRRTGEIYKANKEFASLVGIPIEILREVSSFCFRKGEKMIKERE